MSSQVISSSHFSRHWKIPTSKSYANRALVIAALKSHKTRLCQLPKSTDVVSMLSSLKEIGVPIHRINEETVEIQGGFPNNEMARPETITIHSGDGGTTTRFLMALLARGKNTYLLKPSGPMIERPMDDLIAPLRKLGVEISTEKEGFIIKGPLKEKDHLQNIEVNCQVSSQFYSALLLATSDLKNINLIPKNLTGSKAYVEQTLHLVKTLETTHEYIIPVDFSSASYPLVLGAINPPITLSNCFSPDPFQADAFLLELLNQLKLKMRWDPKEGLKVYDRPIYLRAFNVDASSFPDLVPALCVLASFCQGTSHISGLESLHVKECNRFLELQNIMNLFKISHRAPSPSKLEIDGCLEFHASKPLNYTPPHDHRMIMTAALWMILGNKGGTISDAEHVKKSFPDFFSFINN